MLILGGTGWLSRRVAHHALAGGWEVSCLARGARPAPDGAVLVEADRDRPDAYADLAGAWDHVVDVSSHATPVAAAVEALGARAARWTYVSSASVYADDTTRGADESAARHPAAAPGDADDYPAQKVAAEDAVISALGDRALVVRPGLIAGPGDPSDRFGYWPAAFARAASGDVLAPVPGGRDAQVIDVDDLASYIVRSSATGPVTAVGHPHAFADVLDEARRAAGHTGRSIEAADDALRAAGVEYWAGERSLPLWLPADIPGFMSRSNARYLATGGTLRPLAETIARALADERARGLDRPRRAGLSRPDEEAILAALAADI